MGTFLAFLLSFVRAMLRPRVALAVENAALRQQLATYLRLKKRPKLNPSDRFLWVLLSRFWAPWRSTLALVQPATVIRWHRQGFRLFGARRPGRPYRCQLEPWLWEVLGISGLPTPYRALNANTHVERLNRRLRNEAFDHQRRSEKTWIAVRSDENVASGH